MITSFSFERTPHIIFGPGKINELSNIILKYGTNILIVTGSSSIEKSGKWDEISKNLENNSINYSKVSISGEPSPTIVDKYVEEFRNEKIDLVVGIGGGSVTDAGKAISAMITKQDSIRNYIEDLGTKVYDGEKISYIAIPTTSGTGSEATKNAVISEVGREGFKKSLRHDNLVPDIALIDPNLMLSCPPSITAACGMDAFVQLLEAYVSLNANPITDALAFDGMRYMKDNIVSACSDGATDLNVRAAMAYGSLLSGITLANAGLGIIHGLASPIGGLFDIPHGVVCGALLSEATKMNIEELKKLGSAGKAGLRKHAEIGALLTGASLINDSEILDYCTKLIDTLDFWTKELNIDRLGKYGIISNDIEKIVEMAGLKNNPVELNKQNIKYILENRI